MSIHETILKLSENFTRIIPVSEIKEHSCIWWGGNGVGDRFANKKYNYTTISAIRKTKTYSENEDDGIEVSVIDAWFAESTPSKNAKTPNTIVGIFVHSERKNVVKRPIRKDILDKYKLIPCVVCGTKSDLVCDHKNDLYNEARVLSTETQKLEDFQSLCNHCNLQKRQVCKDEVTAQRVYSAKNLPSYSIYSFEFPWEKKVYDKTWEFCKYDTFWFDPVEFNRKLYMYITYTLPIVREIRNKYSQKSRGL